MKEIHKSDDYSTFLQITFVLLLLLTGTFISLYFQNPDANKYSLFLIFPLSLLFLIIIYLLIKFILVSSLLLEIDDKYLVVCSKKIKTKIDYSIITSFEIEKELKYLANPFAKTLLIKTKDNIYKLKYVQKPNDLIKQLLEIKEKSI